MVYSQVTRNPCLHPAPTTLIVWALGLECPSVAAKFCEEEWFRQRPKPCKSCRQFRKACENCACVCVCVPMVYQKRHVEKLFGNVLIWRVLEVCNTIWAQVLLGHRYAQVLCDTTLNQGISDVRLQAPSHIANTRMSSKTPFNQLTQSSINLDMFELMNLGMSAILII